MERKMFGLLVTVLVSWWNPAAASADHDNAIDSNYSKTVQIDEVYIVGNKRTNENIILREMELKTGKTFQDDQFELLVKSDRERIYNTRLFNSVEIDLVKKTEELVDVVVTVSERWYTFPAPILELVDRNFNDWWENKNHDLSRINYGLKLYQLNMRGRNETLRLTAQLGFTKKVAVNYEIPYIDKTQRNGLEMGFAYTENHNVPYRTVGHKRDFFDAEGSILNQTRLELTYRMRRSFYDYHYVELTFRDATVKDTLVNLNDQFFSGTGTDQRLLSIAYGYRKDKRDVIAYPLHGYKLDASVRKNGLGVFEDVDFFSFYSAFSGYIDLKKNFYLSNHTALYANTTKKISYNNYNGLGYATFFVRGYELYLIEGPKFFLNKTTFKKRILSREINLHPMPLEQFKKLPIQIYLKAYFDLGYVENYPNYTANTRLSDTLLRGAGFGLDFVTWYDVVFRTEYSFNHLGESGFFFHFKKEF